MHPSRVLDIQKFIDAQRLSPCQWLIFCLGFLVMVVDGYDTVAMGFIAPSLVREWGIGRSALGPVMSAALVGVAIGALMTGPVADRFGRKAMLVLSVAWFGAWTLVSGHAQTIGELTAFRFLTGLGLGAAMPNAVTLMSEYAPARVRSLAVNAMFSGFSFGLMAGGVAAAWLIPHVGWRSVLVVGGVVPILLTVPLALLLPESVQFLAARPGTHARVVRILKRIAPQASMDDGTSFDAAAPGVTTPKNAALGLVLSARYQRPTLMLWVAYFMALLTWYLLAGWMPMLFQDSGFGVKNSALMASLLPLGGVLGNLCAGWLMDRWTAQRTIVAAFLLTGVLVLIAGRCAGHPVLLGALLFCCGIVVTAPVTSMAAYAAMLYPTEGRATGVAWMFGIGRFGGVASAFVGAALLGLGWHIDAVFSLLVVPSLVAAGALCAIKPNRADRTVGAETTQETAGQR
ncbi:MFS transporter [Paraburkholderia pallida]|uniref:MFS transporter n=1 Tax=Paraburkholderia pallida TaxID=2547399 RepID=A0A4P7D4W9_9BURK|nr:MFS transporter [Paraburkholderia pallida]QBR01930.1 MFS transporter [Paraburkholderia pallida]